MLAADLKKAQELRKQVANFGLRQKVRVDKKKPVLRVTPFKFSYQALKPKTEVIVREAVKPTHEDLLPIVGPLVKQLMAEMENNENEALEVTPELVKKIVTLMHQLPESDRLDVSGIRNYQSFIYKGTKYGAEEMMHGGGSSTASGGTVYYTPAGTVNASNTVFTVTAQPSSVTADGILYFQNTGYSFNAGTLQITMDIAPSSYIRYTL